MQEKDINRKKTVRLNKSIQPNNYNWYATNTETICICIISQKGSKQMTRSQKNNVLHLRKIKVLDSIVNGFSCDRCKKLLSFTITSREGNVISEARQCYDFGLNSEEDGMSTTKEFFPSRQKTRKQQIDIPLNIQISSETDITLKGNNCYSSCCHQTCRYNAGVIRNHCQNVNVGNVQLQISCKGVSLADSLSFEM
ncbi:hypothetical protein KUTeg_010339 [Tegillarca granosa]|uniref:Uncharacterized protein n=1 Tax=Tegillarca granosa TaxID=220873 RepID=A0ABQ9F6F0_TEGGR|nr:hypothetical protein KUTeg_010339 [Tegillarca granosa]